MIGEVFEEEQFYRWHFDIFILYVQIREDMGLELLELHSQELTFACKFIEMNLHFTSFVCLSDVIMCLQTRMATVYKFPFSSSS